MGLARRLPCMDVVDALCSMFSCLWCCLFQVRLSHSCESSWERDALLSVSSSRLTCLAESEGRLSQLAASEPHVSTASETPTGPPHRRRIKGQTSSDSRIFDHHTEMGQRNCDSAAVRIATSWRGARRDAMRIGDLGLQRGGDDGDGDGDDQQRRRGPTRRSIRAMHDICSARVYIPSRASSLPSASSRRFTASLHRTHG